MVCLLLQTNLMADKPKTQEREYSSRVKNARSEAIRTIQGPLKRANTARKLSEIQTWANGVETNLRNANFDDGEVEHVLGWVRQEIKAKRKALFKAGAREAGRLIKGEREGTSGRVRKIISELEGLRGGLPAVSEQKIFDILQGALERKKTPAKKAPVKQTTPRTQPQPRRKIRTAMKLALGALIAAAVGTCGTASIYGLSRQNTDDIEFPHDGAEFALDDLTTEEKIAQLMYGSAYGSRAADIADRALNHRRLSFAPDFMDWVTDWLKSDENIGGVHLFRSDARDLEETNRTVIEIMSKSKIPPFISMDIVGGYTRHLGLTREDARQYGVPEDFLQIAEENGNLELPSEEDLGRAFEALETEAEKIEFRKKMEQYGQAIGLMCRDLGLVINFAPVMDMVTDVDGESFMAKNDETYGENLHTIMMLSFHYIKGFQQVDGVTIGPKHFTGTGMIEVNLHEEELQSVSGMEARDGSFMPFKDAIHGRLLTDRIHPQVYKFDMQLRRYLLDIERLEAAGNTEGLTRKRAQYAEFLAKYDLTPADVPEDFMTTEPVDVMMVGHAQNFMNEETPASMSDEMVARRLQENLEFQGLTITDDLSMGVVDAHYRNGAEGCGGCSTGNGYSQQGEIFAQALVSGVTMPMVLHETGELDSITHRVSQAIETEEDFNSDRRGRPTLNLTMAEIDARVTMVLDQKVELGLLDTRVASDGTVIYINTAQDYVSSTLAYQ